jgi:hypothetical protein
MGGGEYQGGAQRNSVLLEHDAALYLLWGVVVRS